MLLYYTLLFLPNFIISEGDIAATRPATSLTPIVTTTKMGIRSSKGKQKTIYSDEYKELKDWVQYVSQSPFFLKILIDTNTPSTAPSAVFQPP